MCLTQKAEGLASTGSDTSENDNEETVDSQKDQQVLRRFSDSIFWDEDSREDRCDVLEIKGGEEFLQDIFIGRQDCLDALKNSEAPKEINNIVKIPGKLSKEIDAKRLFKDDINYVFTKDKSKFIGEFKTESCRIIRDFLTCSPAERLYYTKVDSFSRIKHASVAIIHGVSEHSAHFMEVAESLAKNGFVVHMIDLRGFGFSGGHRGLAEIHELHEDIQILLNHISSELPLFLYGHGFGATLIVSLLMRNKWLNITGVILTSPLFGFAPEQKVNVFRRWVIRLSPEIFGEMVLSSRLSYSCLTKDNYKIKMLSDEQLTPRFITLKTAKNVIALIDYIMGKAYNYPILTIHGFQDKIASCQASKQFHDKISSTDKTLKILKDGFHMPHHDVDKHIVKQLMTEWIKERLKQKPTDFGVIGNLKLGLRHGKLKRWHKIGILLLGLLVAVLLRLKNSKHLAGGQGRNLTLLFWLIERFRGSYGLIC